MSNDILISGGDMLPKRNSTKRSLAAEFYYCFNFAAHHLLVTFICVTMQTFSEIKQLAAEL